MRLLAPAKINLHLRVGPVRADGFHPLLTWMCTIGLFDTLDFRRAGGRGTTLTIEPTDRVRTDLGAPPSPYGAAATAGGVSDARDGKVGETFAVPADGTNLVARAASVWVDEQSRTGEASVAGSGLSIVLGKEIPVGAGLGGGSSDAARTLFALDQLDGARLSATRLSELGASLGSDVPFFFHGPSSICTGRGEAVVPAPAPAPKWVLLFLPAMSLSTAHVYQRFDAMKLGTPLDGEPLPDWANWATLPAGALLQRLVNDLEAPAFDVSPQLGALRADLEQSLGQIVRMSGSGSSLFTLFDNRAQADDASSKARASWTGRVEVVELCPEVDRPAADS
ncbi:MAG TPA: 4-(cytidine 5'-diphospho)-2-C-methyl-D-erythritol kinase [Tepidisphaeraceae bacterium]|jgi:4-diphosphocytidyl-2-C-methyl-D-erythritol kinase|nr:4-(cytidine 5'-diphospho)-2-C-methyl-D-erythritol kinase [Tepidisphaeraceae bacterium]